MIKVLILLIHDVKTYMVCIECICIKWRMVILVLRGVTTTANTTFTINSNDCLGGAVVVTDDNEEACARHDCTDQDFIDQDCINNDHHTLLKNIHQQLSMDKVGLSV